MHKIFVLFNYVGSSLSKCTFNGQQCCSEQTLSLLDTFARPEIQNNAFNFDSAFQGARSAIDHLGMKLEVRTYVRS